MKVLDVLRLRMEGGVRRGVGPRLLVLMVRLLAERYHRALSRWKYYTMLSITLTVLRSVSDSPQPSICIAYETIISPVIILGLRKFVY